MATYDIRVDDPEEAWQELYAVLRREETGDPAETQRAEPTSTCEELAEIESLLAWFFLGESRA